MRRGATKPRRRGQPLPPMPRPNASGRRSVCGRGSAPCPSAFKSAASLHDLIEKVPSGAIFAFDDPEVRIEPDLLCEIGFHLLLGGRHRLQGGAERAVGRTLLPE